VRVETAVSPGNQAAGERMAIAVEKFGEFEGKRVDQFTLKSDRGVEVDVINYGVAVRDWRVPVAGGLRSVVLGFDDFPAYESHSPHLGSLAGRVANRIGGASFTIDGVTYKLPANERTHTLHGGPEGLGRIVWHAEPDESRNGVRFTHRSPDGAMGFPGNVDFTATYSLTGNRLRLELAATTDRKTPISVVQHQYFNLGTGPDVLDHLYQINASAFTETDEDLIPTGTIVPVERTQYDLRQPRTLRDRFGKPVKYDCNLVLDQVRNLEDPVATVRSPDEVLTLRLWTDRPGLQFYNGVYTDIPVPGLGGRHYGNHSGFCLEDQAFPDAVHHPHFPSVWYSPERPYAHWCEIEIG
jgi:aldose 1-epimerase